MGSNANKGQAKSQYKKVKTENTLKQNVLITRWKLKKMITENTINGKTDDKELKRNLMDKGSRECIYRKPWLNNLWQVVQKTNLAKSLLGPALGIHCLDLSLIDSASFSYLGTTELTFNKVSYCNSKQLITNEEFLMWKWF